MKQLDPITQFCQCRGFGSSTLTSVYNPQRPAFKKEMNTKMTLIDESGEVRELTSEDIRQFKSAKEVLPTSLLEKLAIHQSPNDLED
jgi:hypothetical protein